MFLLQMCEPHLPDLPAIIVADNRVGDPQTVDVSHDAFQSVSVGVISHNHSSVSHQLS